MQTFGQTERLCHNIRDIKISAGAGFIVPLAGSVMTMPGLPKVPQAQEVSVDEKGKCSGIAGIRTKAVKHALMT